MLFSNEQVAAVINEQFEPAWQSLRPVPRVTIDFGNGTVVNRTLHGNVATYVCAPEGHVLDILPGVYEPRTYLRELARLARRYREASLPGADEAVFWKHYHRQQAKSLERSLSPEPAAAAFRGASIFGSERGTKRAIRGEKVTLDPRSSGAIPTAGAKVSANAVALGSPAIAASLEEDTQINETTRRLKIHQRLAESGRVTPDEISKWLYRDVLGTDLDDPYLGLKEVLFKNYPFADDDTED